MKTYKRFKNFSRKSSNFWQKRFAQHWPKVFTSYESIGIDENIAIGTFDSGHVWALTDVVIDSLVDKFLIEGFQIIFEVPE